MFSITFSALAGLNSGRKKTRFAKAKTGFYSL